MFLLLFGWTSILWLRFSYWKIENTTSVARQHEQGSTGCKEQGLAVPCLVGRNCKLRTVRSLTNSTIL